MDLVTANGFACVFYLEGVQDKLCTTLCSMLEESLKVRIDKSSRLAIPRDYVSGSSNKAHDVGRAYLEFLRKSVDKSGEFRIVLRDSREKWSYLGHAIEGNNYLDLYAKDLELILPAVVMLQRMVLLPCSIIKAFSCHPPEFNWLPRMLEMWGARLVDFSDTEWVSDEINAIATYVKEIIVSRCREQMALRSVKNPNFDELKNLLKVEESFLKSLLEESDAASWPDVTAEVVGDPLPAGKRSQVNVVLKAKTERPLGRVRVQFGVATGTEVSPKSTVVEFSSNSDETQTFSFELVPSVAPFCPVELLLHAQVGTVLPSPYRINILVNVAPA